MEPKKNPKANVGRNSSLYFAIGLALMLFLTNFAINYKTYDKSDIDIGQLNLDDELDEEIPIIEQKITPPPPPPPPPPAPEVIEVVEDEEEVEETIIQSTESSQDDEIVEIEEMVVDEVEEDVEVPFAVIENVPVYPGCENQRTNDAKRKCMSDKITEIVQKRFNKDLASDLGLSGTLRTTVMFKIDKTGNITGVQARGPHPALAKEGEKVVGYIPKMKPGQQRGKPVTVQYVLPIIFQVVD